MSARSAVVRAALARVGRCAAGWSSHGSAVAEHPAMAAPGYLKPSDVRLKFPAPQLDAFRKFYEENVAPRVLRNIDNFAIRGYAMYLTYHIPVSKTFWNFCNILWRWLRVDFPEWSCCVTYVSHLAAFEIVFTAL